MPPMRVKHLLKSAAHQHKDPQVRLAHVRELDLGSAESAERLAGIARTDEDAAVRVAAIERLDDLAVLRELLDAGGEDADTAREAAISVPSATPPRMAKRSATPVMPAVTPMAGKSSPASSTSVRATRTGPGST